MCVCVVYLITVRHILLGRSLSHANKTQLFGNQYTLHRFDIPINNHIKLLLCATTGAALYCSKNNGTAHRATMTHRLCIRLTVCRCGTLKLIMMFGSTQIKTQTYTVVPFKSWWDLQLLMSITKKKPTFVCINHCLLHGLSCKWLWDQCETAERNMQQSQWQTIIGNHTRTLNVEEKKKWWFGFNFVNSEK